MKWFTASESQGRDRTQFTELKWCHQSPLSLCLPSVSPLPACCYIIPNSPNQESASQDAVLGLGFSRCPEPLAWPPKGVASSHTQRLQEWRSASLKGNWGGIDAMRTEASSAVHYPASQEPECFLLNRFCPDPWSQTSTHLFDHLPYLLRWSIDVSLFLIGQWVS